MGLQEYRRKRDFAKTPEPGPKLGKKQGFSFVIQKHDATRLHYDFRLELDGVLKSWAVTRGPSLMPGEKRLAVEVEDHPLAYGGFEGIIPEGEYGGGAVIVWDRGVWKPLHDPHKGLNKGHLDFELEGEKLGGAWHLVRMRGKPGEKRNNWLLIKSDDEAARGEGDKDILVQKPKSVLSGVTVEEMGKKKTAKVWHSKPRAGADISDKAPKKKLAPAKATPKKTPRKKSALPPPPAFVRPMLAVLRPTAPSGDRWLHEIKFDGYRMQARLVDGEARLLTRKGLDWTHRFGAAIADALAGLDCDNALIDGEIVVDDENGVSDFALLTEDLGEERTERFVYCVFDLLFLDGVDLRKLPLIERKAKLEALVGAARGPVKFSAHFAEDGERMRQEGCRLGLEGIISKLAHAPYTSDRGGAWVKSKCTMQQEFVIAGFTRSTALKGAIAALALGVQEKGGLRYVGRVGTGFSNKMAVDLAKKLQARAVRSSPFSRPLATAEARGVTWVKPDLVADVEFRAWTGDYILRHAAFKGLREDKPAAEVVAETGPMAKTAAKTSRGKSTLEKKAVSSAAYSVKLTHPDRLYWPDVGITKQMLADFYADVWPWIEPHVAKRPLALVRCMEGAESQCFFQKAGWKGMNAAIKSHVNKGSGGEEVLAIDSLDGLVALAQSGVLEIHPWGCRLDDMERPDMLTMDLDPDEDVPWKVLADAAREVRDRFADLELESFVKTTGGKGLHVVVPLTPKTGWDEVKDFAHALADAMAADALDRFVSVMTKSKREGKIFVDYLRNGRGATAVAAYSTRARSGAPVATPIAWTELKRDLRGAHFNVETLGARLKRIKADPWAGFFDVKQTLPNLRGAAKARR